MLEEGHREGRIQESEAGLIRNIFGLDDTDVSDIYTPLQQVFSLPAQTTLKMAKNSMREHFHSRIPITGANRGVVIRILYAKDLLLTKLDPETEGTSIASLMRKPFTVNSSMRLNVLFRKLKQHRTHMAIVEDNAGVAVGVVTMARCARDYF